jgi:zinc transporter 2
MVLLSPSVHVSSLGPQQTSIVLASSCGKVLGCIPQECFLVRCKSELVLQDQEKWQIADPICTLTFAVIVFCTTIRMVRDIADIVMERVPRGYSIAKTAHDLAMVCVSLTELELRVQRTLLLSIYV